FACSPDIFCSPIQRPSGVTDIALGNPCGLLNSLVVFAFRTGSFFPPCAKAVVRLRAKPAPRPAARNSRFVIRSPDPCRRSHLIAERQCVFSSGLVTWGQRHCVQISLSQTNSDRASGGCY